MPRHAKPSDLTINLKSATETAQTSSGPNSSPINVDLSSFGGDFGGGSAQLTSLPPLPSSPPTSPRHNRDPSKNFLNNFKTRIAPEQQQQKNHAQQKSREEDEVPRSGSSSMSKIYHLRQKTGSTPELSLVGSGENVAKKPAEANNTTETNGRPQPSPHHSEDSVASSKRKDKPFRNPLARSKSIRRDSHSKTCSETKQLPEQPPKTAPVGGEWTGGDMLKASKKQDKRGKSAERAPAMDSMENVGEMRPPPPKKKDKEKSEGGGFMSGSKNVVSKATKGGGSLFTRLGKIGRSSSSNEKDIPDSEYVLKVINLPLVEQTRITRISKDLNSCRDKTEYWMPSLPWRAIDYLNLNCESEGLYRVPGGFAQIKHWQRRFDTELDIDLLDEKDLYDPNEIGSMLKKWLTDLPNEMMPANIQSSLAAELEKENPDYKLVGQAAPQKLRDALSELPPFNYYLLFAVTCHLSLLLSNKDKNKMDLHNLSVCIGPCLKLERWLFNYLVGDWRHCWQGCFTEKQYLEAEKAHEQGITYQPPASRSRSETGSRNDSMPNLIGDERAVHSSGSSKPGSQYEDARSLADENEAPRSKKESKKDNKKPPDTYRPAGSRENSSNNITTTRRSPPPLPETKRPATSDGKDEEGSSSKTSTPRQFSHGRSKSDVATTPIKTTYGSDHQFPMPERRP